MAEAGWSGPHQAMAVMMIVRTWTWTRGTSGGDYFYDVLEVSKIRIKVYESAGVVVRVP